AGSSSTPPTPCWLAPTTLPSDTAATIPISRPSWVCCAPPATTKPANPSTSFGSSRAPVALPAQFHFHRRNQKRQRPVNWPAPSHARDPSGDRSSSLPAKRQRISGDDTDGNQLPRTCSTGRHGVVAGRLRWAHPSGRGAGCHGPGDPHPRGRGRTPVRRLLRPKRQPGEEQEN